MDISKGIRTLPEPQDVSVLISPTGGSPELCVVTHDGDSVGFRISKKVAEVLIAYGIPYQG